MEPQEPQGQPGQPGQQPWEPQAPRPPAPPTQSWEPQAPPPAGQPPVAWQTPVEEVGPAPGIRFAPHGARLVAYILDAIILGVAFTVLFMVVAVVGIGAARDGQVGGAFAGGVALVTLLAIVVTLAYFPYFWSHGGQTPGMRPFRLRVVRDADGGPVTTGQAVLRLVGYWVNQVTIYIGFAWILVDKRRRGWHDLIAGTCVIETPN